MARGPKWQTDNANQLERRELEPITEGELKVTMEISKQSGYMAIPVTMALLTMRPRPDLSPNMEVPRQLLRLLIDGNFRKLARLRRYHESSLSNWGAYLAIALGFIVMVGILENTLQMDDKMLPPTYILKPQYKDGGKENPRRRAAQGRRRTHFQSAV